MLKITPVMIHSWVSPCRKWPLDRIKKAFGERPYVTPAEILRASLDEDLRRWEIEHMLALIEASEDSP